MSHAAATDMSSIATIVERAAAGDETAFARLIAEHHASMIRVATIISGDPDSARDAVQSAWIIAWRRLGTVRDRSQVRAWLMAVTANEARQARRRQRRATVVDISDLLELPGDADPGDSIPVVDLKRAFARLSPDERALLALRYVADLDSNEIAVQLKLSASGVRSRLARLLERLRADLEPAREVRR
jgi:RNA polymerase sigma-70 factor (ECF subfamily)